MWHDGRRRKITKGQTIVSADDPIVRGREKLFRPLHPQQFGHVEQATAAPGEKRSVGRRKRVDPEPEAALEPTTEAADDKAAE
jgi:hypothetical protein